MPRVVRGGAAGRRIVVLLAAAIAVALVPCKWAPALGPVLGLYALPPSYLKDADRSSWAARPPGPNVAPLGISAHGASARLRSPYLASKCAQPTVATYRM